MEPYIGEETLAVHYHKHHSGCFAKLIDAVGDSEARERELIDRDFGSFNAFLEEYRAAATGLFGSGWAWLVVGAGGLLRIVSTDNAGNPLLDSMKPLLVIDVWEHAYYLDYRDERARHVDAVVDRLLDWSFAEANLVEWLEARQADAGPAALPRISV